MGDKCLDESARIWAETSQSYYHMSVQDIIKAKEDYGLGWIALREVNSTESKILRENGIITLHEILHASQWGYGTDISENARIWAEQLYANNPFLGGMVIDWEEDPSSWPGDEKNGEKLLETLRDVSHAHGAIFIGEPRPILD
jgi:hypothetical protein